MDLAENRFRKTWERFLEVLKVDCHGTVSYTHLRAHET